VCTADVSGKLYRPSAYYVAKQLAVLPFAVLNSLLFAFTLYGLAGLRHSAVAVGINGLMSVLTYLIAAQVCVCVCVCATGVVVLNGATTVQCVLQLCCDVLCCALPSATHKCARLPNCSTGVWGVGETAVLFEVVARYLGVHVCACCAAMLT
jgi:hypothetical protein